MKLLSNPLLAVGFLLAAAILIGGCIFIDGENLKAKWEKDEEHTVPLDSGALIQVETHNGQVIVVYNNAAHPSPNVRIVTYNDNIHFTGPDGLSAQADLSTHNGSIRIHD